MHFMEEWEFATTSGWVKDERICIVIYDNYDNIWITKTETKIKPDINIKTNISDYKNKI